MPDQTSTASLEPTPNEILAYRTFVRSITQPFIESIARPPVLWHYTNGSNLINIVDHGKLYSTQVSCLNDQSEIQYSRELLRQAVRRLRLENGHSDEDTRLLEFVEENLGNDVSTSEWFVVCFSAVDDDLSQWRAYTQGEGGYSIGFHTDQIQIFGARDECWLIPVCYDAGLHYQMAEKVARETLRFFANGYETRKHAEKDWTNAFWQHGQTP